MFKIDDVTYRNIVEQVQKNKSDIEAYKNVQFTLDSFGITVLGIVDSESDIPEQEYNYGDAYLVGEEEPYDIYIFTRDDEDGEFVNMGPLSIIGPKGPAGTITIGTVTTGNAGTNASVTNVGTQTDAILNFTIPKGDKGDKGDTGATGATGAQGIQGPQGPQGIQGIQGIQGDPGQSFMIMGTISSTSQLPDPSETPRNEAYVLDDGDLTTPNQLYYITGAVGSEQWSHSTFAGTGTTVTVNGSQVTTYEMDNKQDKLVSGTSIKTINSTTLLGSGNISVQEPLTSGTNIRSINGQTLLTSGDLEIKGEFYDIDLRPQYSTSTTTHTITIDSDIYTKLYKNIYGFLVVRFDDYTLCIPTAHQSNVFLSGEPAYFYRTTFPSDRLVSGKMTIYEYDARVIENSGTYTITLTVSSYEEPIVKSIDSQTGALTLKTINSTSLLGTGNIVIPTTAYTTVDKTSDLAINDNSTAICTYISENFNKIKSMRIMLATPITITATQVTLSGLASRQSEQNYGTQVTSNNTKTYTIGTTKGTLELFPISSYKEPVPTGMGNFTYEKYRFSVISTDENEPDFIITFMMYYSKLFGDASIRGYIEITGNPNHTYSSSTVTVSGTDTTLTNLNTFILPNTNIESNITNATSIVFDLFN